MAPILVVDDDHQLRRLLSRAISAAGHAPVEAGTGYDAIQCAQQVEPAVLLIDFGLGKGQPDGLAVFKAIHQQQPSVKGIMMTGFGSGTLALECGRAGMVDYLEKPFLPGRAVRAISRALDARASDSRKSHLAAETGIDDLRAIESLDVVGGHLAARLKALLLDMLTDPGVSVPVLLTCAPVLRTMIQQDRSDVSNEVVRSMAMRLREDVERIIATNARTRTEEVAEVLALMDDAAVTGSFLREFELGKQVHRSRSQVSRGIASATGFPFLRLVRGYRLRPTLRSVLMTVEPLDQILTAARYDDDRQFRRDFRAVFGLSARELRDHL